MSDRYYFLTGDVNWREYGAKWIKRCPYYGGTEYYVLELINWEDAQGEPVQLRGNSYDYPNMYGGPHHNIPAGSYKYSVQVTHFDTSWYDKAELERALESSGWDGISALSPYRRKTALVEAYTSYGLGDTIDIRYGNNAYKLLQYAKRGN